MNKIKITIPEEVKSLIKDISENSPAFDVYLCGGALRDWYCGKDPKDLDIMFIPKENKTLEATYTPLRTIINYCKPASDISDMQERGVHQLIGMTCYTVEPREVQYIVYGKYLSQEEVTKDMDMNIAQVSWKYGDEECLVTNAFLDGFTHKYIECLHKYDHKRMFSRYERMQKKFTGFDVVGKPVLSIEKLVSDMSSDPEGSKVKRAGGDY